MVSNTKRRATTDVDREAGRLFRAARERAGLSQEQAAARSGYSTDSIYKIERGDVWPPYESLQRLAAAYGILPGDFFSNSGASNELTVVEPLLASLRGLSPAHQNEMVHHLAAQVRMTQSFIRGVVADGALRPVAGISPLNSAEAAHKNVGRSHIAGTDELTHFQVERTPTSRPETAHGEESPGERSTPKPKEPRN